MRTLQSQISWCARVQWTLASGMLAMVLGFYLFGYRPNTQRLTDLRQRIDAQRQELAANQQRTDDLPRLALEVARLKEALARYDKRMPRQQDVGQFLGEITQISQGALLRHWDATHGSPSRSELFGVLPFNVKFQAEFPNVVSFLRQVEDMTRLTRIRDIEVRSIDKKLGLVEVDMTMNIYFSEG